MPESMSGTYPLLPISVAATLVPADRSLLDSTAVSELVSLLPFWSTRRIP